MPILSIILRFLFSWIDGVVAKVITIIYGLLMDLASLRLYSESIVKIIGQRIGILLGIFMLFRLAVSLINYMISPEKFSDNKQGGAALIKNVIISLALLATVNTIFETAYMVQEKVVKSQIIEKIFFGETSNSEMDIGYYLYSGFFTPNKDLVTSCDNLWDPTFELPNSECNEELGTLLETNELNTILDAKNHLDMSRVFLNYDLVTANDGGVFKGTMVFDYIPIISTAAGIVALLILISFSMELAKRAIKLLFLQIVAPVPIIFNMDTGKGKDVFQKWTKECINTYISVFIRILAIDFAVFMTVILKSEFSELFQDSIGVNIFIIIGSLMFAKEVPKLIENMFGIKMEGGMTLNPLKKFEEQALFGKHITGAAAGLTVGTAGALSGAGFGRVVTGSLGGLFGGKGLSETLKNQAAKNNTMREARADGSTFMGRRLAHLTNTLGLPTPSKRLDAQTHEIDKKVENINKGLQPLKDEMAVLNSLGDLKKQMEQRAESKILEGKSSYSKNVLDAKNKVEALKSAAAGITRRNYATEAEYQNAINKATADITAAETNYNATLKASKQKYVEDSFKDKLLDESGKKIQDAVMNSYKSDYNEKINSNKQYESVKDLQQITTSTDWDSFDKQDIAITDSNQELRHKSYPYESLKANYEQSKRDIQTADRYRSAKANERAVGK